MVKFKLFNVLVTIVYRLFIYIMTLSPLAIYFMHLPNLSPIQRYLYFIMFSLLSLSQLILLPALVISFLPKLKPGVYELGSKEFYLSLLHDSLREVHSSSSFVLGIINRFEGLRILIYTLYGAKVKGYFSLSYNSKLLTPSLMTIGKNSYFAIDTLISCHFIKKGKLILYPFSIGDNSVIGADCKVACGADIGSNTYLDTGVKLSSRVKLGDNVKIMNYCEINDDVVIGNKSIVGKVTRINTMVQIGTRSVIGEGSMINSHVVIGDSSSIGNASILDSGVVVGNKVSIGTHCLISKNVKIGNGAKIADHSIVPENFIIKDNESFGL